MDKYYHPIRIDTDKCDGRRKCMRVCPTQAIRVKGGKARLIEDLCVDCGECIKTCPSGAIIPLTDPFGASFDYKYKVALPSPVLYSQFRPEVDPRKVVQGLKAIGFDYVYDLSETCQEVSIAIEKLANDYPGLFEFDRATGRLRFKADITFDSGSNVVKPGARDAIAKLGGILASADARGVVAAIVGHTDTDAVKKPTTIALLRELGKATDNQGLSEARSESVADILRGAGVEATRMNTRGVGSSQPIAPNTTPAGKAQNRRVEIFLREPQA